MKSFLRAAIQFFNFKSSIHDRASQAIEQNWNPGTEIIHQRLPIFDKTSFTGADLGGGCSGYAPPPPRDDLRLSNTTGILQKIGGLLVFKYTDNVPSYHFIRYWQEYSSYCKGCCSKATKEWAWYIWGRLIKWSTTFEAISKKCVQNVDKEFQNWFKHLNAVPLGFFPQALTFIYPTHFFSLSVFCNC